MAENDSSKPRQPLQQIDAEILPRGHKEKMSEDRGEMGGILRPTRGKAMGTTTFDLQQTYSDKRSDAELYDYERFGVFKFNERDGLQTKDSPENTRLKYEKRVAAEEEIKNYQNKIETRRRKNEEMFNVPYVDKKIAQTGSKSVLEPKLDTLKDIDNQPMNLELMTSVFNDFSSTQVAPEIAKIIEGVINKNRIVYIGPKYDYKHDEFLKTCNIAFKMNNAEFDQQTHDTNVTYIDTHCLQKNDVRMIRKHLYDTRTAIDFPVVAVE